MLTHSHIHTRMNTVTYVSFIYAYTLIRTLSYMHLLAPLTLTHGLIGC